MYPIMREDKRPPDSIRREERYRRKLQSARKDILKADEEKAPSTSGRLKDILLDLDLV